LLGGSIPRACAVPGTDGPAYPVIPRGEPFVAAPIRRREDRLSMSTRTLILLAAVTGLAILAAGAIQILLAR
jgi:hypothetical protein